MCGIAGFLGGPTWRTGEALATLIAMLSPLAPRGPDGEGHLLDEAAFCAIGHRRLAILDPSPRGAQPMTSRSGRYVIAFNGEVYQCADLLARLSADDQAWCGRSDTAALLASIDRFGLEATLGGLHAMYAFALWDRADRRLTLARDSGGIKPLYVAEGRDGIAFASTTAALRVWPGVDLTFDRSSLALYARFGYWPAPRSAFAEVRKVRPGEIVSFEGTLDERPARLREVRQAHLLPLPAPPTLRFDATGPNAFQRAVDVVQGELDRTVAREMIADRPVGLFLSGGIDSSLIAASMTRATSAPVMSFSAGFDDPTLDESVHAAGVAKALGLRHVSVPITSAGALRVLSTIHQAFDEPLSDMAAVPTLLLAERARAEVGVVLTGDGGDEAFGGYDRYGRLIALDKHARRIPAGVRRLAAAALVGPLGPLAAWLAVATGRAATRAEATSRLERLADAASNPSRARLYRSLMTLWPDPARLVGAAEPPLEAYDHADRLASGPLDFAQRVDLQSYLPDALFVKTDRATMAHGLEARVPLAAPRLIALGLAIPEALRHHGGAPKAVLRAVLARRLDRALFDRPKQGFSVPMATWLRGPLRDWAESLIGPAALRASGLFDPALVSPRWAAHQTGQADFSYSLWAILMAQDFTRQFSAGRP